jgi:hypothetical protein
VPAAIERGPRRLLRWSPPTNAPLVKENLQLESTQRLYVIAFMHDMSHARADNLCGQFLLQRSRIPRACQSLISYMAPTNNVCRKGMTAREEQERGVGGRVGEWEKTLRWEMYSDKLWDDNSGQELIPRS